MNKEIIKGSDEVYEQIVLLDRFRQLGPNARRVLLALADRLVKGIEHGDFDKPHDWDKESAEEALDLAVYQAAKLLGLGGCAQCTARGHGYPSRFADCSECKGSPELDDTERGLAPHGKPWPRLLVDEDGRTPDGKPWVPPPGARVHVVARRFYNNPPYVGDTFTVVQARQYSEDWILSPDDRGIERLMCVVPAERDSRWAVSAPRK